MIWNSGFWTATKSEKEEFRHLVVLEDCESCTSCRNSACLSKLLVGPTPGEELMLLRMNESCLELGYAIKNQYTHSKIVKTIMTNTHHVQGRNID